MQPITADDILKQIRRLMTMRQPQICRHYIAASLLSLLESKGWPCSRELAAAVVDCQDEEAIKILDAL